ncbi:Meiotic recombination protein [Lachnellula subtilissima]|uniref:Meiotic recombination protein n=1 Tax=Lachnellula subtilissima TaxID=602034 RepID=A0A8H8RHS1_9HELO|nr:Meiotic recombination protein [Lachnellula subtilissima]
MTNADDVQTTIVDIDEIQAHVSLPLVTGAVGANMWKTLCACPSKRLLKIKGFSDIKVEKIKEVAKKLSPTSGFITAAELGQIRKRCIRISTGSKQLDAALNG